ncbi:Asp-tRNA(Asn)/Glu-tRNA(Gln) amidotransferase subunit GatC [Phosphitispora sp. TUW77]|uniref:Asp-tRNA(Asn)/Glu-tRNA(Gln) amidotransferase subunit GatC n=1 Tax=Phosphitispora sp. TUW77 TaxID=3152361 RepID=UPI003AB6C02C
MLTKEQVEHVALLGRLELSDGEKEIYATQLSEILKYFEALNKLDTENIPPTAHVLPIKNVFREDKLYEGLDNEKALANAPAKAGDSFKVPRII